MCGIAGLWHRSRPRGDVADVRRDLERMLGLLHHRGPDGRGTYFDGPVDGRVALGHTRLAIIDLDTGAQPMGNEDGSVQVVFNGEIFNYRALRAALVERGHRFATASDTEVLVHLYEEHGDDFLAQLNGQFALALWDQRRQRLLLARDRAGIRPLYYSWAAGEGAGSSNARLAFASEIKALLALPGMPRRLDAQGLAGVWSLWTALAPRTVFEGVSALPPAHAMAVEADGNVRCWRYWDWPFDEADEAAGDISGDGAGSASDSDEARAQALRELVIDAVRLQLQADVPVAAYLSGGLDSSAIAALVAKYGGRPLVTFSLTFDDAEFDESAHQREVAQFLGTPHRPVHCTRADIGRAFARAVWHAETPLVRTAPVPMMLLADAVRASGCKVALTGEGADEVFAGYDLFKEARVRRFIAAAPGSAWREGILRRLYPWMSQAPGRAGAALARPFLADLGNDPWAPAAAHTSRVRSAQRLHAFLAPEWRAEVQRFDALAALAALLPASSARWPPLAREQYLEANTLMSGYLLAAQGDRMATAASIEARFPFLDHRVMEFGARLPARLKLRGLHEKVLLKRALRSELPATIVARHKQPYRAPDSASFFAGGRLLPEVAEPLSAASLADAGLFDAKAVGKLVDKCASGRAVGFADNMAFVGVLSTMLLHEQFVRGRALGL